MSNPMPHPKRSTRVLAHPDGSFSVEWLAEVRMVDPNDPLAIPKIVKRWARDPGFENVPGRIGAHTMQSTASQRAYELAHGDDDVIYSKLVDSYYRTEDLERTESALVN